jgi:hypothetical protein
MTVEWFDIQWRDTKGSVVISHEFAEDLIAAERQFDTKLPGFARNGSVLAHVDFVGPSGPLPLTPGCCLG